MTKVVIKEAGETPSEQLVKAAVQEVAVTDAKGRAIVLKKPGVLAQYRLVKLLGEDAENRVYMSMVAPLIYAASIDGDPIGFPQSGREIDVLIQRLDEDGVAAVMKGVMANWGALDPEADKDALKN